MKLPTSDDKALGEYYDMLKVTPESELSTMWEEITVEAYWYWFEVVAPARTGLRGFATGEPTCDGVDGTIHETCITIRGRCFRRPATIEMFDTARYTDEICKQFVFNPVQS